MRNKKTWLILSFACILMGLLFTALGVLLGGIPGFYLDKNGVHTSRETVSGTAEVFQSSRAVEGFDRLDLQVECADIVLVPSNRCAIDYRVTGSSQAPVCQIENGTLSFIEDPGSSEPRIWFFYAGPDPTYIRDPEPGPYYVEIEYPADQVFSSVRIRSGSGDLQLPALQADTLDLQADYGDVSLEGYSGQTLKLQMSSGTLSAGSICANQAELRNDYGEVSLNEYDGEDLTLHLSSGSLTLGRIEAERVEIRDEYGDVYIEQASGGRLTADLDSGNFLADSLDLTALSVHNEYGLVRVSLLGDPDSYGYQLRTEYGTVRIGGQILRGGIEEDGVTYLTGTGSDKTVEVSCENGDIIIALLSDSL